MKRINEIKARLSEIANSLQVLKDGDITEDVMNQMETLTTEVASLDKELATLEKAEKTLAALNKGNGRQSAPASPTPSAATPRVEVGAEANDRFGGFKSTGDFFAAVRSTANGRHDKVLNSAHYTSTGEDGGFLVPPEFHDEVVSVLEGQDSLLAKTTQYRTRGNSLEYRVDSSTPWGNGIKTYWVGEGVPVPSSKANIGKASLKLNKAGALVEMTEEMLEDSTLAESYILAKAPEALMHTINGAILSGNGVDKPQGILHSGFTVKVAKEDSQTAGTVNVRNLVKMEAHTLPHARRGLEWFVHCGLREQLRLLKDDNGNFIYLGAGSQLNQSPYDLLMGMPVNWMMHSLPAAGEAGDIMLGNLKFYDTLLKAGRETVKKQISIHAKFEQQISSFLFTVRIDGGTPLQAPIKSEYGDHMMSAFVALQNRQ